MSRLFDVPELPDMADMSPTRRLTARRRLMIESGIHPRTRLPLADNGETCGTCAHYLSGQYQATFLRKCDWSPLTHGPATDVRVGWPACTAWEARS